MTNPERPRRGDAVACYILNRKQSAEMIAKIMGKTEEEVKELVNQGEKILRRRKEQSNLSRLK